MVSIFVILVPILIAAIIILAVGLSYKKRLNKAVNGEENVHSRSVAPGEILPWILVLLLLIWNAVSLSTTFRLTQEISNLQSQLMSYSTTIQEQINDINTTMQDTVATVRVEMMDLEKGTNTVRMHVTVAPKAYSDDTTVSFTHGSETVDLVKNGSMFEGDVHIGLFENADAYVTITTGGVSQVRMVNDIVTGFLWMDFLPTADTTELNLNLSYNSDGTPKELSGIVNYTVNPAKDGVNPIKAYLVVEQNGVVLKTIDLPLQGETVGTIEVKEALSIENDTGLTVSVAVENDMGLTVQRVFWYIAGEDENYTDMTPAIKIFDQNNNLLFTDY